MTKDIFYQLNKKIIAYNITLELQPTTEQVNANWKNSIIWNHIIWSLIFWSGELLLNEALLYFTAW
jgi:hypothetical protein